VRQLKAKLRQQLTIVLQIYMHATSDLFRLNTIASTSSSAALAASAGAQQQKHQTTTVL